jgi:hypothetical protein
LDEWHLIEYHIHVIENQKIFGYLYYMKRLLYLYALGLSLTASAQSFPVKNVNDEYFVTNIYNPDVLKTELHESARDKNGLYWFQFFNEIYSFDGVN